MDKQTAPKHVQLRLDNCIWCGKPLPNGRYDRRTHNECRQKYSRWKKKMYKARDHAIEQIVQICSYLEHEPTFLEGIENLKEIQTVINDAYKSHNIVRVK